MANIKSQIKRNRQNEKHRVRNRVYRGAARTAVKNARTTIEAGTPESKTALLQAISVLDKAAARGVLHKNNAARRKSRLMKAFARMEPVPVKAEVETGIVEPVVEVKPRKAIARKQTARKEPEVEVKPKTKARTKADAKPKAKAAVKAKAKAEPKKTTNTRKKTTAKKP